MLLSQCGGTYNFRNISVPEIHLVCSRTVKQPINTLTSCRPTQPGAVGLATNAPARLSVVVPVSLRLSRVFPPSVRPSLAQWVISPALINRGRSLSRLRCSPTQVHILTHAQGSPKFLRPRENMSPCLPGVSQRRPLSRKSLLSSVSSVCECVVL